MFTILMILFIMQYVVGIAMSIRTLFKYNEFSYICVMPMLNWVYVIIRNGFAKNIK